MRKPSWDSTAAKTIRTLVYEVATVILALLAMPEVMDFLVEHYPGLVAILTILPVILTYVVNFLKKDVDNY